MLLWTGRVKRHALVAWGMQRSERALHFSAAWEVFRSGATREERFKSAEI
jgi:hypothetical protein